MLYNNNMSKYCLKLHLQQARTTARLRYTFEFRATPSYVLFTNFRENSPLRSVVFQPALSRVEAIEQTSHDFQQEC